MKGNQANNASSKLTANDSFKDSSLMSISRNESLAGSDNDSPLSDDEIPPPKECCGKLLQKIQYINATNLHFNQVEPGVWDEWGVYYCSSRFGRHTQFNPSYFALTAVVLIGQSNFFSLIHLMQENGGIAFVFVLIMSYVSFGYPTYILESLMGQYSGKKPMTMIRNLMPVFSGLGVALYIRTYIRAINVLGHYCFCVFHAWDLLFCKGAENSLLKRVLVRERDQKQFHFLEGLGNSDNVKSDELLSLSTANKPLLLVVSTSLFLTYFVRLPAFGAGMKMVLRMLLLFLAGYTLNGYRRANTVRTPSSKHSPMTDLPFALTFRPDWIKIMDGRVWVKAIVFVIHSMELGTLVHPYLGSKVFFHYRSTRDGVYLILLVVTWNALGCFGVLYWLGYIGISETEIKNSLTKLEGHYGMFIVFIVKHIQAELTSQVESDVLFFCALFYGMVGIAAMLAVICHMYILIDSTYPESGHPLLKLMVMISYFVLFAGMLIPVLLTDDGLRHLTFLTFYVGNSWTGIFLIICYAIAVCASQGMARLLHDFYNIIHLKGYEVRTHFYYIPKVVPFLYIGFLVFALVTDAVRRPHPTEGVTDWTHPSSIVIGILLSLCPVAAVVFGAVYYLWKERKDKTEPLAKPHRDFYKNKHHICVCFKDYENFFPKEAIIKAAVRAKSKVYE